MIGKVLYKRLVRIALAVAICFLAVTFVSAQIAGGLDETTRTGLGGRNFIVGTVFGPDGLPLKIRTSIRLSSVTANEILASTDDQGNFIFSGVPNGQYTLTVNATGEYESASQTIDIDLSRGTTSQSYAVSVRLQPKRSKIGPASVISADAAGVSKKAMEHYRKAVSLETAGDTKAAITELNASLKVDPTFVLALVELGILELKAGDLISADTHFVRALAASPDSFDAMVNRGIGLFRQKRFTDAETSLRGAVKLKPDSDLAHFYLGRTLLGLDSLIEAEKELNSALALSNGKLIESHRMLTQVYIQQDAFEKALRSLDAYLAANPTPPDLASLRSTHDQLGRALAATKAQIKP